MLHGEAGTGVATRITPTQIHLLIELLHEQLQRIDYVRGNGKAPKGDIEVWIKTARKLLEELDGQTDK